MTWREPLSPEDNAMMQAQEEWPHSEKSVGLDRLSPREKVTAMSKEEWRAIEAVRGECSCDPAWKDRGRVDDRCPYHRLLDAIEDLRIDGWTVHP